MKKEFRKLLVGLVILLGCLLVAHFSSKAQIGTQDVRPQNAIYGYIYLQSGECFQGYVDALKYGGKMGDSLYWVARSGITVDPHGWGFYHFTSQQLVNQSGTYRIVPHPESADPEPNYAEVYWEPGMSVEQDFDFGCIQW